MSRPDVLENALTFYKFKLQHYQQLFVFPKALLYVCLVSKPKGLNSLVFLDHLQKNQEFLWGMLRDMLHRLKHRYPPRKQGFPVGNSTHLSSRRYPLARGSKSMGMSRKLLADARMGASEECITSKPTWGELYQFIMLHR